jgi:hypothetical protein
MKPIRIGCFDVPVRLSNPEDEPDLLDRDAYYDTEQLEMVIDETNAQDKRALGVMHETGHGVCDLLALAREISERYKIPLAKAEAIEETYLRLFLPVYIATLINAGWLKPPRVI